jgi:hypothetical protein
MADCSCSATSPVGEWAQLLQWRASRLAAAAAAERAVPCRPGRTEDALQVV